MCIRDRVQGTRYEAWKPMSEAKKSPVLLAVLYLKSLNIEPDVIYEIFSPYGRVLRVLIFGGGVISKAFIEFATIEEAEHAKNSLEGATILEDGTKASIFFANIDKIVFKTVSPAGKDYTHLAHVPATTQTKLQNQVPSVSAMDRLRLELESKMKQKAPATSNLLNLDHPEGTKKVSRDDEMRQDDELLDSILDNHLRENLGQVPKPFTPASIATPFMRPTVSPLPSAKNMDGRNKSPVNLSSSTGASFLTTENLKASGLTMKASGLTMKASGLTKPSEMKTSGLVKTNEQKVGGLLKEPPGLQKSPSDAPKQKNRFQAAKGKNFDSVEYIPESFGPIDGDESDALRDLQMALIGKLVPANDPSPEIHAFGSYKFLDFDDTRPIESFRNDDSQEFAPEENPVMISDKSKGASNIEKFSHILSDHKSPVIYVKGFDSEIVNVTMIYNVFSNFGNIMKIMYMRLKGIALIEYETVEFATIAKDYLNNMNFIGNHLRIYFSKYNNLIVRTTPSETGEEEVFIGSAAMHRFKAAKSIAINSPSTTLHVSNLLHSCCKDEILMSLFGQFGKVEAIKFLFHDNNRNMCLIRYTNLSDAVWALANLHNYDLAGRRLQISFTRSKI
eukprot:TRINITY_DN8031_c0_g1_i1.p1 TRINITY_DN8031_c0_g1~~TRINITY_DN8031_c0_g1_i1.p1  ORF type:complete len:618 (-),score=92.15 TRINITY_DN8031_c0_g1_i1:126-1979(-)